MNDSPATLTERAPEDIEAAYWSFKGGSDGIGLTDARELLDVTQTARISRTDANQWCVTVFLKKSGDDVPAVVERTADAHDIVEVERDYDFNGNLNSVTFSQS